MLNKISEFVFQTKQEASKVTWASKKETSASAIAVIVVVVISAAFFLLVDMAVHKSVQVILGLGS